MPPFRLRALSAFLDGLLDSSTRIATRHNLGGRVLLGITVALCLGQRGYAFLKQVDNATSTEKWTLFQPERFLTMMQPYTRLATLCDPVPWSQDTKAYRHQVLGSAGRSIILNKAFKDYLQKRGLIEAGFSLTSYWNERKAHETGEVPISSGYTLGFWRGREERGQAQFL